MTDRTALLTVPVAAILLLWPAAWNGYPIVFADTGTYLSQAVHHYAGWDRPVFYSLFMLALHWTITLWPVIIAQALLAGWILWLCWRATIPRAGPGWFLAVMTLLSAGSWLPWVVGELMPDILTPLLIATLALLYWAPHQLARWERWLIAALATFCIISQQSSVPLAIMLVTLATVLSWRAPIARLAARRRRAAETTRGLQPPGPGTGRLRWLWGSVGVAMLIACAMNLAAHGRFSVAPFGNIFILARVIYDGPGAATLHRDCPTMHWRLCPYLDEFPPDSDKFLWAPDSPLARAGGPKRVSEDANAIIGRTISADPWSQVIAVVRNTKRQLLRFGSGDGLQPWPREVSPWLRHDFPPAETTAYTAARQQNGILQVPSWLAETHRLLTLAGLAVCLAWVPWALRQIRRAAPMTMPATGMAWRHQPFISADAACPDALSTTLGGSAIGQHAPGNAEFAAGHASCSDALPDGVHQSPAFDRHLPPRTPRHVVTGPELARAGLLMTMLVGLLLNAAIAGALSRPHDRYQARLMWLPPFLAGILLTSRSRPGQ